MHNQSVRRDAAFRTQPSLFEAMEQQPTLKPAETVQQKELKRVTGSIGDLILEFFHTKHVGEHFFASELHDFVRQRAMVAPASADRVMRDLKKTGQINYELVSRRNSEYRVEVCGVAG